MEKYLPCFYILLRNKIFIVMEIKVLGWGNKREGDRGWDRYIGGEKKRKKNIGVEGQIDYFLQESIHNTIAIYLFFFLAIKIYFPFENIKKLFIL